MTICFAEAPDAQELFVDYDRIAQGYTGWSLADIKKLPARERRFWAKLVIYRRKQQQEMQRSG